MAGPRRTTSAAALVLVVAATVVGVPAVAASLLLGGGTGPGLAPPEPADETVLAPGGPLATEVERFVAGVDLAALSGSSLTGPCFGFAFSYDDDGTLLDGAADLDDGAPPVDLVGSDAGSAAFTKGNPFRVSAAGKVHWAGRATNSAGEGPMDYKATLEALGITIREVDEENSEGRSEAFGVIDPGDRLPPSTVGLVKFDGDIRSANGISCDGSGYVKFEGSALTSPIGIAGGVSVVAAAAGLWFVARPRAVAT